MAQFFGSVQGNRGAATRLGNKQSGLNVTATSWSGSVRVDLYEEHGRDFCRVMLMPWRGSTGPTREIYSGPIDGSPVETS